MNQMSSDHSKLRHALIHKLDLFDDRAIRDNEITEAVEKLIKERDKAVRSLESAGFTDNGGQLWKPPIGTPPPYLSQEIRYVLHGDIQPCSVLYSDEATTLLRLDEGDIMCETDTIEWSDPVTYRCQELLKLSGLNKINLTRVSGHLAQLVRDERILLNDGAELCADEAYFRDGAEADSTYEDYSEQCLVRGEPRMLAYEWRQAGRPAANPRSVAQSADEER